jgi:hypothetical protein
LRGGQQSDEAISMLGIAASPRQGGAPRNDEVLQAQKTVESFENLLKNGVNADNASSLFNYFSPDILSQDKIYKNKILDDIKNLPNRQAGKKEQLNFKVLSYEVSSKQKNQDGTNYQAQVEEIRDYGQKTIDYGSKFSRVFILEKVGDNWKIKSYEKINNNNVYSGILSGSRKYDGFYP